jgi:tetrahydromethanopterin S-methyltransferase subunit A
MEVKQLYHIDNDTLISMYPKGMILEVKKEYTLTYRMDKLPFAILFLLSISHPHIVTYEEISDILESIDIELKDVDKINKKVVRLRKELKSYGVKHLIVSVKGVGYAISNKWVEPQSLKACFKNSQVSNYIKRLCGLVTRSID